MRNKAPVAFDARSDLAASLKELLGNQRLLVAAVQKNQIRLENLEKRLKQLEARFSKKPSLLTEEL